MVVNRDVGDEDLLDEVEADPKDQLLEDIGNDVIPPKRVWGLVDVDRQKIVVYNALQQDKC